VNVEIPSAVARGDDANLILNYQNGGTGHAEDVVLTVEAEIAAAGADNRTYDNTDQAFLSALAEDVSGRTVWNPRGTLGDSLDALGGFAQGAVDVLIWVVTFGVPAAAIASVGYFVFKISRWRGRSTE